MLTALNAFKNKHYFFDEFVGWTLFFVLPLLAVPSHMISTHHQKWLLVYLVTFIMALRLWLHPPSKVPVLSFWEKFCLFGGIAFCLMSLLLNLENTWWLSFLSRISFLPLVLYFFKSSEYGITFLKERYLKKALASLVALTVLGFFQYSQCTLSTEPDFSNCYSAGFSTANNLAQALFLGGVLSLPLLGESILMGIGVLVIAGILLLLLRCRSVLLGIVLSIIMGVLSNSRKPKLGLLLAPVLITLVALGFSTSWLAKTSQHQRLELIQNSASLIIDNPLGVGIGNFGFAVLPYSYKTQMGLAENLIADSPHNTFLRLASEEGLLVGVFVFVGIGLLIWSRRQKLTKLLGFSFFVGMLGFWITETTFQFPLDNPYPFVGAGLFGGLLLSTNTCKRTWSRWPLGVLALITGVNLIGQAGVFLKHRDSVPVTISSSLCRLSPDFWDYCRLASRGYSQQRNWSGAQNILKTGLKLNPNNYLLFHEFIVLQYFNGDIKRACQNKQVYDQLFQGRRPIKVLSETLCKEFLLPIRPDQKSFERYLELVKAL